MKAVLLEKSDTAATLSTWLYCAMWQLYTVEKMGDVGYVNWPNQKNRSLLPHQDPAAFARCPNMFEWYFEQPQLKVHPGGTARVMEWERSPELGTYPLMSLPLADIKAWYQSHLLFNVDARAWADRLISKYAIDFDKTIGVQWRGCDSVDDGRPRLAIELYFPYLDAILEKEPDLRIFATAEETTVVDKILARYPNAFTIPEFFSAPWGYKLHSEFVNPASGYERGMQTCGLLQLLSRCKHLVKNRSNMSYTASYLSNGNIVCIQHPEVGV